MITVWQRIFSILVSWLFFISQEHFVAEFQWLHWQANALVDTPKVKFFTWPKIKGNFIKLILRAIFFFFFVLHALFEQPKNLKIRCFMKSTSYSTNLKVLSMSIHFRMTISDSLDTFSIGLDVLTRKSGAYTSKTRACKR